MELLDHMRFLFLIFWGPSHQVPQECTILHSQQSTVYKGPGFHNLVNTCLYTHTHTHIYCNYNIHSNWCEVYLTVILIFDSLMICDIEHFFICPLTIYMSSLEKCLFKFLVHFYTGLLVFLLLSCSNSLHILEINPLTDASFANTLPPSTWCLFTFFTVPFAVQKLPSFI